MFQGADTLVLYDASHSNCTWRLGCYTVRIQHIWGKTLVIKGDFAYLQAINFTAFTTGDLVFMGGTKFLPV